MTRKTKATHATGIPCGLPSPGSRLQGLQGEDHRRPATEADALVEGPGMPVTCKRCRRIVRDRLRAEARTIKAWGHRLSVT